MEKYLYFRTEATLADDDDIATSAMFPVSSFVGAYPTSDTALTVCFKSANNHDGADAGANAVVTSDTVVLTVGTNKHKEALQDLVAVINAHPNGDPFIVVGDDNAATYLGGGNITAVGAITIAAMNS